jgi:hypothetical protein
MCKKQLLFALALMTSLLVTAQSGQKWATGLNSLSTGDALGSSNNMPLIFKTNSIQYMSLGTNGVLQLKSLIGSSNSVLFADANGNLFPLPAGGSNQVLYGNGAWGNLPVFTNVWSRNGNDAFYTTGNVGIGTNKPAYNLDVTGNVHISTDLIVDNGISIGPKNLLIKSGANGELFVQGATILGGGTTIQGSALFTGSITNPTLAGTGFTVLYTGAGGLFNILPASTSGRLQFLGSNGQWMDATVSGNIDITSISSSKQPFINFQPGDGNGTAAQLNLTANTNVQGDLNVSGAAAFDSIDAGQSISFYGAPAINVTPGTIRKGVRTPGALNLLYNTNVQGNISVTGSVDVSSITSNSQPYVTFLQDNESKATFLNLTANTTSISGNLNVAGNATLNQLSINQSLSSPKFVTSRIIGADTNGIHFGDSSVVLAYPSPSHANLSGNQISYDNVYSNLGQGRLAIGFAYALGNPSLAFGTNAASPTKAYGNNSIAFGMGGTESDAVGSIAFGFNVKAGVNATKSIVIGSGIGISTTTALIHNAANSLAVGFNSDIPTFYVGGGNGTHNSIGKVGIGTITPAGLVEIKTNANAPTDPSPFIVSSTTQYQGVDGKLFEITYNGQAHAREIFVKITSFPDYVFKKDYALMPLSEVEKYYKANQHLPEVPSEKEVKENGLNVGDMNVILLKKIEELTLYTVELEKKLKALEEKVNK